MIIITKQVYENTRENIWEIGSKSIHSSKLIINTINKQIMKSSLI